MDRDRFDTEEEAIRKAILDYYHEGHVQCDPELYKEILHPDWKFFMLDENGELQMVDRTKYCEWWDPKNREPGLEWETEFHGFMKASHPDVGKAIRAEGKISEEVEESLKAAIGEFNEGFFASKRRELARPAEATAQ